MITVSANPASLDPTFESGSGFQGGNVFSLHYLDAGSAEDARLLVGGAFTTYAGEPAIRLALLDGNGNPVEGFQAAAPIGTFSPRVETGRIINVGGERKVLIGGWFTSVGGVSSNSIARLNADGSVDESFDPGTGTSNIIHDLALDSNGSIVIAGNFTVFDGETVNRIARLNSNGSLMQVFGDEESGIGFTGGETRTVAIDANDRILVGGAFNQYGNETANRLIRLNPDGSIDNGFNLGSGFNDTVRHVYLASSGHIFVSGEFTTFNGDPAPGLVKLDQDGARVEGFSIGNGFNGPVNAVALDPEGRILVAGDFTGFNGQPRTRLARLQSNGALDGAFHPGAGANQAVHAVAVQGDGKIFIAGDFTSYNETTQNRIARLTGVAGPIGEGAYADWVAAHFEPGEEGISGPEQDPDGDGIPNLLEYAFNGDPRVAFDTTLPALETVVENGDRHLRISFVRIDADDIIYQVQASTNLSGWTEIWNSSDHPYSGPSGGSVIEEVVDLAHTVSSPGSRFLRVVVVLQ